MSSLVDTLFGGESDKAIRAQSRANERTQQFIEQQAAQGRRDILNIVPDASESLRQGNAAAQDVSRRGPQAQLRVLGNAAQRGEEALLAGAAAYENAIMGLPTGMGNGPYDNRFGLNAISVGSGAEMNKPFHASQRPEFLTPGDAPATAGGGFDNSAAQAIAAALFPERFGSAPPSYTPSGPATLYDIGLKLR